MKKIISIIILSMMLSVSVLSCSQSGTEIKENTENSIVIWANLNTNEIEELQKIADTWTEKNGKDVIIYSTSATGADFIETAKSSKPDMFLEYQQKIQVGYLKQVLVRKYQKILYQKMNMLVMI